MPSTEPVIGRFDTGQLSTVSRASSGLPRWFRTPNLFDRDSSNKSTLAPRLFCALDG